MMNNTSIAAAVASLGLMLAACGGLHTASTAPAPAPASADVITALERACLDEPLNAAHWARLAAALDADGQRARATRLYQQAATLSAHDARRDYALLAAAGNADPKAATSSEADVDATLPRTQIQKIGAAMVQVVRAPATATASAPAAASSSAAPSSSAQAESDPVRLEISNGNGVTGAAARLARTLDVDGLKTTRLTNVKHFNVPLTRIEYPDAQQRMAETLSQRLGVPLKVRRAAAGADQRADLRLVLGLDASARQLK
jgi:hypothetical protein